MKNFLIFLAGAGVGALGTWLVMRNMYEVVDSEHAGENDIPEKDREGGGEKDTPAPEKKPHEKVGQNKELYRVNENRVQYDKFSKGEAVSEDEMPHPRKLTEEEVAEMFPEDDERIYVIDQDRYLHERMNYDKDVLYFYTPEEILANEDGVAVDDIEAVIGIVWQDHVGEDVANEVFVRNVNFETDYEVVVVDYSFYDRSEY